MLRYRVGHDLIFCGIENTSFRRFPISRKKIVFIYYASNQSILTTLVIIEENKILEHSSSSKSVQGPVTSPKSIGFPTQVIPALSLGK